MKLYYTEVAVADLSRLRSFLELRTPDAAARVAGELGGRLERLQDFPLLDRPVVQAPDPQSVRDLVFGDSIVRYTVSGGTIVVLRVWHHNEQRNS